MVSYDEEFQRTSPDRAHQRIHELRLSLSSRQNLPTHPESTLLGCALPDLHPAQSKTQPRSQERRRSFRIQQQEEEELRSFCASDKLVETLFVQTPVGAIISVCYEP